VAPNPTISNQPRLDPRQNPSQFGPERATLHSFAAKPRQHERPLSYQWEEERLPTSVARRAPTLTPKPTPATYDFPILAQRFTTRGSDQMPTARPPLTGRPLGLTGQCRRCGVQRLARTGEPKTVTSWAPETGFLRFSRLQGHGHPTAPAQLFIGKETVFPHSVVATGHQLIHPPRPHPPREPHRHTSVSSTFTALVTNRQNPGLRPQYANDAAGA